LVLRLAFARPEEGGQDCGEGAAGKEEDEAAAAHGEKCIRRFQISNFRFQKSKYMKTELDERKGLRTFAAVHRAILSAEAGEGRRRITSPSPQPSPHVMGRGRRTVTNRSLEFSPHVAGKGRGREVTERSLQLSPHRMGRGRRIGCVMFAAVLLLLCSIAGFAATIAGTLRDISIQALDTKLMFAPTNAVLVTGNGLSAGPPKVIDTVNGAFSIVLEAGDYTVSVPLIPWRNPFRISVMDTNATLNITNVMTDGITYSYTNNFVNAVRDSTNVLAAAFNQSLSALSLPHLQKALNDPAHKLKLLWLGDSTGADSIAAFSQFLNANFLYGTDPICVCSGIFPQDPNGFFDLPTGCNQGLNTPDWWFKSFSLTNNITQTFGGTGAGDFVTANKLSFWYSAKAGRGTCILQTSPNNSTWTTVATVDTTTGPAGLRLTNISLTTGKYNVRVKTTVGGTENRVVYLWPELQNTATNSALFFDGHADGQILANLLAMGTNNIASLLTNYNPDVILYEQTKPVYTLTNWPAVAWLFKTYASNSDVVIVQSQCASDPALNSDPANGGPYQMGINRMVAITNDWAFVDNYTPLSDWTNFIVANGFNGDDTVHLNTAGRLYSGYCIIRQLGLVDQLAAAGVLKTFNFQLSTFNPLYNTTNIGPFTVQSSNVNFAVFDSIGSTAEALWMGPLNGTAGPWMLQGDRSGTTFLRGNNGIFFHTTSSGQALAGYLWPSGGWSFMDEWNDGLRTIDPGTGNIIVGGKVRAGSGVVTDTTVNATNGFLIATIKIVTGSGSPESAITAPVGSVYLRTDGGSSTTIYVKESGSGNTGWVGK
jgi:hypothetical protein